MGTSLRHKHKEPYILAGFKRHSTSVQKRTANDLAFGHLLNGNFETISCTTVRSFITFAGIGESLNTVLRDSCSSAVTHRCVPGLLLAFCCVGSCQMISPVSAKLQPSLALLSFCFYFTSFGEHHDCPEAVRRSECCCALPMEGDDSQKGGRRASELVLLSWPLLT